MTDRPDPPIRHKPPVTGAPTRADSPLAPPAPRERLVPKALQRVLGFMILFATVGMLSCQALFD